MYILNLGGSGSYGYNYSTLPSRDGFSVTIHGKGGIGIEKWAEENGFSFEQVEETPQEGYTTLRIRVIYPKNTGYYVPTDENYLNLQLDLQNYFADYDFSVSSSKEMQIFTGDKTGAGGTLKVTDVNPYYFEMPDNTVEGDGLFNIEFGKVNVINISLDALAVETTTTTEETTTTTTEETTTTTTEETATTTEGQTETSVSVGDIDNNGTVDARDASALLEKAAAVGSGDMELTPELLALADLNADEKISATDAAIILQYAAETGAGEFDGSMEEYLSNYNGN